MANIYQHVSQDKVLILSPREAFQRKFDVGSWNELRLGMFYDTAASTSPTSSIVGETVTQNTRSDIVTFGLKDSATSILPGFSGSYFFGLSMSSSYNPRVVTFGMEATPDTNFHGTGFYGTASMFGGQTLASMGYPMNGGAANLTDYMAVYGLKLVINNRGLSTQTISISAYRESTISSGTSFYSSTQLNRLINNGSYGTVSTVNWNDGSSAYPIPDSFWIRFPFYDNQVRISALTAIRYS